MYICVVNSKDLPRKRNPPTSEDGAVGGYVDVKSDERTFSWAAIGFIAGIIDVIPMLNLYRIKKRGDLLVG